MQIPDPTLLQADDVSDQHRHPVLSWLERTFAATFRLAKKDDQGEWRWIAIDKDGNQSLEAGELSPALVASCVAVASSNWPSVSSDSDNSARVAVPVIDAGGNNQVALAERVEGTPGCLERMAELWMTASDSKAQAEQYHVENAFFAEQLCDGLEELTFLRAIVRNLDMSDAANDLLALAEGTLPLLNDSVKAECTVLLMAPDGGDPHLAVPTLRIGKQAFDDEVVLRITKEFGTLALRQPVVRNFLSLQNEQSDLPGVREFILVPLISHNHQLGWLVTINRDTSIGDHSASPWPLSDLEFGTHEASLLSTTASILATHASNLDLLREKEQLLVSVVRSLVSALDAKDEYTCGHSERVAEYARILGEQIGMDEDACRRIYMTGLLHDVGKIGVSDAVLKKEGRLTDDEFAEIRRHPDEGWAILHDLSQLQYALPGVLYHHEQVNGTGYPDQLAGDEIPLEGRLLAIVDSYDAMTSDRPYRKGMPPEKAQAILRDGAGTQWDAELIEQFFAAFEKIEELRNSYQLRQRPLRQRGSCV